MKLYIYLKDPDGFSTSVDEEVEKHVRANTTGLDEEELEGVIETRREQAWKKLSKWVEYQEYIGIDFDLETMTATVRTRK